MAITHKGKYVLGLQPDDRMPNDYLRMVARVFAAYREVPLEKSVVAYIDGYNLSQATLVGDLASVGITQGTAFVDDQFVGFVESSTIEFDTVWLIPETIYHLVLFYQWINMMPPQTPTFDIVLDGRVDDEHMLILGQVIKHTDGSIEIIDDKISWWQELLTGLTCDTEVCGPECLPCIAQIKINETMDIGWALDFHNNVGNNVDYDVRLHTDRTGDNLYINNEQILTTGDVYEGQLLIPYIGKYPFDPLLRPNGLPLGDGDIYYNERDKHYYYYTKLSNTIPLWVLFKTINNPNPHVGDLFAHSCIFQNNTLLVGAPNTDTPSVDSGQIFVYEQLGSNWLLTQTISNPEPTLGIEFGRPLSLLDNTLIIGCAKNNSGAQNAGSVYAYSLSQSGWTLKQTIRNPEPAASDFFGYYVKIINNMLIVSAVQNDNNATNSGSVYVYIRNDSNSDWVLTQTLNNPDSEVDAHFGESIQGDEGVLLIGTLKDKVYYYTPGVGVPWQYKGVINDPMTSQPNVTHSFGAGIVFEGTKLIIRALEDGTSTSSTNTGIVYFYEKQMDVYGDPVWNLHQIIHNPFPDEHTYFGMGLAIENNNLVIGAYGENNSSGCTYTYEFISNSWSRTQVINNPSPGDGDWFGRPITLNGNLMTISAWRDDEGSTDAGTLYIFTKMPVADGIWHPFNTTSERHNFTSGANQTRFPIENLGWLDSEVFVDGILIRASDYHVIEDMLTNTTTIEFIEPRLAQEWVQVKYII